MFGCDGLYADELFIGIVAGGRLFLKTNAATKGSFEAEGSEPFVYGRAGKQASLGFHEAPLDAMDSPESMRPWASLAIQAALAARRPSKSAHPKPRAPKRGRPARLADKPKPQAD